MASNGLVMELQQPFDYETYLFDADGEYHYLFQLVWVYLKKYAYLNIRNKKDAYLNILYTKKF